MPNYTPPAGSGGGGTPDDNSVTSAKIVDGAIVNADINAAAAVALSKLATDPLARANHTGTQAMSTISDAGSLATKSAVASADITDGTIVGGDLSSTIALPSGTTATTQSAADGSTKPATTAYVDTAGALKANLASPTFSGTVTLPSGLVLPANVSIPTSAAAVTQTTADNSTKVATTAYVDRDMVTTGQYLRNGSQATVRMTCPRWLPRATFAITSGTLYMMGIDLLANDVVSFFGFQVTANATLGSNSDSHWYLALYNSSRTILASTADQTTTVITTTGGTSSGPFYKVAVGRDTAGNVISSYTVPATGTYYAALMVYFGTGGSPAVPSVNSFGLTNSAAGGNPDGMNYLAATSNTVQTTGTPPGQPSSTAAAFNANGNLIWIYVI